jgi:hypothetical protein
MDDKNYKALTHEKFRRILKFYYKVVYGNNELYPEAVSWFSDPLTIFQSLEYAVIKACCPTSQLV